MEELDGIGKEDARTLWVLYVRFPLALIGDSSGERVYQQMVFGARGAKKQAWGFSDGWAPWCC